MRSVRGRQRHCKIPRKRRLLLRDWRAAFIADVRALSSPRETSITAADCMTALREGTYWKQMTGIA